LTNNNDNIPVWKRPEEKNNNGKIIPFKQKKTETYDAFEGQAGIHKKLRQKKEMERKRAVSAFMRVVMIVGGIILFFVLLIGILAYAYKIETVVVEGNIHYTESEIRDMVITDTLSQNSLYLNLKSKYTDPGEIPFIEDMEVTVTSPHEIKITVYEKTLAGYITYLGKVMYFDRDGIVVETDDNVPDDIPEVLGLDFSSVVLYDKLPADNDDIFDLILNITLLLEKYSLDAKAIYFDNVYDIFLFIGDVKVSMGEGDYLEEKFIHLSGIMPNLEGKSGTLRMEDFTPDSSSVTFEAE